MGLVLASERLDSGMPVLKQQVKQKIQTTRLNQHLRELHKTPVRRKQADRMPLSSGKEGTEAEHRMREWVEEDVLMRMRQMKIEPKCVIDSAEEEGAGEGWI